jgi:mannose-6-phosphate isomerase-like protein (cupin superfamily)
VNVTITVTNEAGQPIEGAAITAAGPLERSGSTDRSGALRIQGMRVGTYRLRFDADGYLSFEKELVTRASPKPIEVAVTLTTAPALPPPPPPPPPPAAPKPTGPALPPQGMPRTLIMPDWIEQNFISSKEAHKESVVGCSGLGQAMVWQVRDSWTGRQHTDADGFFYVIGGDGNLQFNNLNVPIEAGSFAMMPRGTTYSFTKRSRDPLIVLGTLTGVPCTASTAQ